MVFLFLHFPLSHDKIYPSSRFRRGLSLWTSIILGLTCIPLWHNCRSMKRRSVFFWFTFPVFTYVRIKRLVVFRPSVPTSCPLLQPSSDPGLLHPGLLVPFANSKKRFFSEFTKIVLQRSRNCHYNLFLRDICRFLFLTLYCFVFPYLSLAFTLNRFTQIGNRLSVDRSNDPVEGRTQDPQQW